MYLFFELHCNTYSRNDEVFGREGGGGPRHSLKIILPFLKKFWFSGGGGGGFVRAYIKKEPISWVSRWKVYVNYQHHLIWSIFHQDACHIELAYNLILLADIWLGLSCKLSCEYLYSRAKSRLRLNPGNLDCKSFKITNIYILTAFWR